MVGRPRLLAIQRLSPRRWGWLSRTQAGAAAALLLAAVADPNAADETGTPALALAAEAGDFDIVWMLLECDAERARRRRQDRTCARRGTRPYERRGTAALSRSCARRRTTRRKNDSRHGMTRREDKTGTCRLCREREKLCRSHIVQEFAYKSLYGEKHSSGSTITVSLL